MHETFFTVWNGYLCAHACSPKSYMRWEATPEITLAECIVLNENPSITQINIAYELKYYICCNSNLRLTKIQNRKSNGKLCRLAHNDILWPNNQYATNQNWHSRFLMWCTQPWSLPKNYVFSLNNSHILKWMRIVLVVYYACMSIRYTFTNQCEFIYEVWRIRVNVIEMAYDWHNKYSVEFSHTQSHLHLNIKLCVIRIL